MLRKTFILCWTWLLMMSAACDAGARQDWTLQHYQHTAFTKKDGAPLPNHVVQTSDGYLWGDDNKGLVRFDGNRFEPFTPQPGEALSGKQVEKMFAPTSGGLWVSFDEEGASFIYKGHITNYGKRDGFGDRAADFYQDRAGHIIAYAYPGLLRLGRDGWKPVVETLPLQIRATTQDPYFNIWAVTRTGRLLVLREGSKGFVDAGVDVSGALQVMAGPDHSIFVGMRKQSTKRYVDQGGTLSEVGRPLPHGARGLLIDQRGYLWAATASDGIHFFGRFSALPRGDAAVAMDERINRAEGLTGNFTGVFEDNKGTIWVPTDGGIDRFTPSVFSQVALPSGTNMVSIAPGKDGDVWIGSEHHSVRRLVRNTMLDTAVPATALTIHTEHDGAVFAATAEQLWQLAPGDPRVIADLPAKGIGMVKAILKTDAGEIWLSSRAKATGLVRLGDKGWQPVAGISEPLNVLERGGAGTIWGGGRNHLVSVTGGSVRGYREPDGLATGNVKAIAIQNGLVWLGGDQALQVFDGRKFKTLKLAGRLELSDISGLVFDQVGNLWVHTVAGLIRIEKSDAQRASADSAVPMPYRLFDSTDGLPGAPAQTFTLPTIRLGADGRLWVTGQTSAAWLDPAELNAPSALARPLVEQISDGKRNYDVSIARLSFPQGVRDLHFIYTTPELQYPERVRFQYRLRGLDDRWQDAGVARRASYQNLAGGAYTFEVRSAWQQEPWGDLIASVPFEIALVYYETWWFKLGVALLAATAILALVRYQMVVATRRERMRMQIRLDEREAVARDLHDTLLQSNVAVVLQLKALSYSVSDSALKEKLENITRFSRDADIEARNKVQKLRSAQLEDKDGIAEIINLGQRLASDSGIGFTAQVSGIKRTIKRPVWNEMGPLLSELLHNAFHHSGASDISVTFAYGWWRFRVAIADNGIGIDDKVLAVSGREGHWGLRGVYERAARIRARVTFERGSPRGTIVHISIRSPGLFDR